MKKNNCLVLCTFLVFISFTGSATHNLFARQTDSLLIRLNKVLENSEEYTKAKLGRIERYHRQLRSNPGKEQVFTLLQNLSEEYKTFVYDSAFTYIQKMLHEAYKQGDAVKIAYAKTNLGFILLSSGMFKETLDSLNTLNVT